MGAKDPPAGWTGDLPGIFNISGIFSVKISDIHFPSAHIPQEVVCVR